MCERGVQVHYLLGSEVCSRIRAACRPYLKQINELWSINNTYIKVNSQDRYFYRVVVLIVNTLDFLLTARRIIKGYKIMYVMG